MYRYEATRLVAPIPGVDHPVRIAILGKHRNSKTPRKAPATNRTRREVNRVLRTYRHRWRGTECFLSRGAGVYAGFSHTF